MTDALHESCLYRRPFLYYKCVTHVSNCDIFVVFILPFVSYKINGLLHKNEIK